MNTPKIRFKGFEDDWEQRKVGEVVNRGWSVYQTLQYQDQVLCFYLLLRRHNIKVREICYLREAFERDYKVYPSVIFL